MILVHTRPMERNGKEAGNAVSAISEWKPDHVTSKAREARQPDDGASFRDYAMVAKSEGEDEED